jgi:hypothetical protein
MENKLDHITRRELADARIIATLIGDPQSCRIRGKQLNFCPRRVYPDTTFFTCNVTFKMDAYHAEATVSPVSPVLAGMIYGALGVKESPLFNFMQQVEEIFPQAEMVLDHYRYTLCVTVERVHKEYMERIKPLFPEGLRDRWRYIGPDLYWYAGDIPKEETGVLLWMIFGDTKMT